MSSQAQGSGAPPMPPVPSSPPSSGVRRHHTISASSRSARQGAREIISEETDQQHWDEDEVVDQDWVVQGVLGAVGEKTSLHRQSSLPARYPRTYQTRGSRTGTSTPKPMNSLTAIAGHEGDEEDWERDMRGLSVNDEEAPEVLPHQQTMDPSNPSPLSPHFGAIPSPPPAGAAGVRRHVSLTYGAGAGGPRKIASQLKRSGTLQAPHPHGITPTPPGSQLSGHNTPSPPNAEEEEYGFDPYEYVDEYASSGGYEGDYPQGQYANPASPIGRSSPWNNTNTAQSNDWRGVSTGGSVDDVQRALSTLELSSQGYTNNNSNGASYQGGQAAQPPRFNNAQQQASVPRNGADGNNNNTPRNNGGKLQLVTDFDGRKTPQGQQPGNSGPASASAYVPNFGAGINQQYTGGSNRGGDERQVGGDRGLSGRSSNPNLGYGYQQGQQGNGKNGNGVPNVPPIPQQYLQQQQQQQRAYGNNQGVPAAGPVNVGGMGPGFISSPIDVPSLIASKGYNPPNFDIKPQFARYFVIKSYTEDDVHKSLKYEIWSSTDPGNKRLDKAFKECAGRGPIYLFFSVNASGHFCGMAEMLTPVDYTRSSTVWASDKWKGVFKVRWIFVRDIPNVNLRHIKLNNTQERKPVTNSRDTQELLPEAGQEMLRIFHSHPARTSLLQDFAFYELQALQKMQPPPNPTASPNPGHMSPPLQSVSPPPQQQYAMQNSNQLAFQMPQMTPMMQMQMNMGMNMGMAGSGFGMPQTQAMHQSVMRHPSPGPSGGAGANFMPLSGFQ
ncbi:YTH-domain-containing protein [Pleurotus eryngii]|uniref:YTH-domain-containing protein n=1 Tax=Pleurotus eryngii TaxID=5323 RepID=A0A9P6D8X6_PLEER|nr:YTH-domain-containing protein [Pleurotus eryngii]